MSINVKVLPSPNVNISIGSGGNLLNLNPQSYTSYDNNIQVSPSPNVNILVNNNENLLNVTAQSYILHADSHISGGIDPINHNNLSGLQGGTLQQYYHLNSGQYINLNTIINSTGNYTLRSETGQFYPNSNPSGFITGVNLTNVVFITGNQTISGTKNFTTRPTVNSTGIVLVSETGQFYPRTNPSGYINELTNVVFTTGNQIINGQKTFHNSITTRSSINQIIFKTGESGNSIFINVPSITANRTYTIPDVGSSAAFVLTSGPQTITGTKTFGDVYINRLFVTGTETIANTTVSNIQSPYLLLNLTGGAFDGGVFFVTGSGLTGINDSGAIIGFDHSDKFKFGISTRASDLSSLPTIGSVEEINALSGNLQSQIVNLNNPSGVTIGSDGSLNQFGAYAYQNIFGNNAIGGNIFGNSANYNQFGEGANDNYFGNNTIGANFFGNNSPYNDFGEYAENYFGNYGTNTYYSGNVVGLLAFNTRPTVNGTGVLLSGEGGSTIINTVYTTGDQSISGIKTFLTGVNISGDLNLQTPLSISNGGTNATTVSAARTNFGLGIIDSPTFSGVNVTTATIGSDVILSRKSDASLRLGATDTAISSSVVTADFTTDLITWPSHGLKSGCAISFSNSGGALFGGLTAQSLYYVTSISANTFKVAANYASAMATVPTVIDLTTTGSGINTARAAQTYQSINVQNYTGTNVIGAPLVINASQGAGLGGGGQIIFRTAAPGAVTGSTQNPLFDTFTIDNSFLTLRSNSVTEGVRVYTQGNLLVTTRALGGSQIYLDSQNRNLYSNDTLNIGNGLGLRVDGQAVLRGDAGNILAQRNFASPQISRLYNTFTARGAGTTNLEALETKAQTTGSFIIQSLRGSLSGVSRDIEFRHGAIDTNAVITNGSLAAVVTSQGLALTPPSSVTPAITGQLMFEATSDTGITIRYKGTDGTVRSAVIALT